MNLYKITINNLIGTKYYETFIVSNNPDSAIKKLKNHLNKENYGIPSDRSWSTIELIASEDFIESKTLLLIDDDCHIKYTIC